MTSLPATGSYGLAAAPVIPAATRLRRSAQSFTALGPALTRVTVEHRGWEALTGEQLATDCALPGGYSSGAYSQGWEAILACLAEAVGNGASPAG
jgi:hypothetical protein